MDIRSHEIIDRRRDLATENGNNGGGGGNVTVSSMSNEDTCNGGNNTNTHTQTLDQPKSQSQSQSQSQLISKSTGVRYRECLKNHAASVGGSVHDGCGEFMPSGEEGTIEALRCAACDCHRNFHRKEIEGIDGINHHRSYHHQYGGGGGGGGGGGRRLTPPSGMNMMLNPLMLPPPPSYTPLHHHHHHHSHKYGMNSPGGGGGMVTPMSVAYGGGGSGGGGGGGGAESSSEDLNLYGQSSGEQGGGVSFQMSKKRFRTKFTMDQKERMMEFAEKLGWRMNKQDEEELKRFCGEIGVKRQVFKVWMHNNKNNAKKHLLPSPPLI